MTKPLVYLAGPIAGLAYHEATDWRGWFQAAYGEHFQVLSPMRGKENLRFEQRLQGSYEDHLLSRADAIVMRDLTDVDRCDLLIANGLGGTMGTAIEVGYAVARWKPIVLVARPEDPIRQHPFVQHLPKLTVVKTLQDAAIVARSLFNV